MILAKSGCWGIHTRSRLHVTAAVCGSVTEVAIGKLSSPLPPISVLERKFSIQASPGVLRQ